MSEKAPKVTKESNQVDKEVAELEIKSWLDAKKIDEHQREEHETFIKSLIANVQSGNIIINEDYTITHKLKFPLSDLDELKYAFRINAQTLSQKLKIVKSDDGEGRLKMCICVLTGQVKGIIEKLDTEDSKIARAIAVFFM